MVERCHAFATEEPLPCHLLQHTFATPWQVLATQAFSLLESSPRTEQTGQRSIHVKADSNTGRDRFHSPTDVYSILVRHHSSL